MRCNILKGWLVKQFSSNEHISGKIRILNCYSRCISSDVISADNIVRSPYKDILLPSEPLHKYVWQNMQNWPNHTAIECGLTGKKFNYKDLRLRSKVFGSSLRKIGLNGCDAVAIILPNMPEYPLAFLGIMESGLIPVTINPNSTIDELNNRLKIADVKCVVCHPMNLSIVLSSVNKTDKNIKIICTQDFNCNFPTKSDHNIIYNFEHMMTNSSEVTSSDFKNKSEVALITFSSGTTGLPKAVQLTHRSMTAQLAQTSIPEIECIDETNGETQVVVPGLLPLFHMFGIVGIMMKSLLKGAKIITLPQMKTQKFLEILNNNSNIVLFSVPPLLIYLNNRQEFNEKTLTGIRKIIISAAPCGGHEIEKIRQKSKNRIFISHGFGMTESNGFISLTPNSGFEWKGDQLTVGSLIPNTLAKVIDLETGEASPSTEVGELCFKGPQLMNQYFKNPEATERTIDKNGWLHSGDIGFYDNNGNIYVTDRLKDMIKVNGFQVAPAEIEQALRNYPGVLEAGVVGIPCSISGETPVAFVRKDPNLDISANEVMKFLATQLDKYKLVSSIKFVDTIPKNPSGKIMRKHLRSSI